MAVASSKTDSIQWSVDNEIHLFDAMTGFKPVGVNRHFHMLLIWDRFCGLLGKQVDTQLIWHKLNQLYDMNVLHEMEEIPFPNDVSEFRLPDSEFDWLLQQRIKSSDADDVTRSSSSADVLATPTAAGSVSVAASPEPAVRRSHSVNTAASDTPVSTREARRASDAADIVSSGRRASKRTCSASTSRGNTPVSKRPRRA